MNVYDSRQGA